MKNRILILLAAMLLVLSASCAQKETDVSDSSVSSAEVQSIIDDESMRALASSLIEIVSDSLSDEPSSEAESSEPEADPSFCIESENGSYMFVPETNTGSFSTEFSAVTNEKGGIVMTLADGRIIELPYTEVVYDEENDIYRTEINGMDFLIEEFYDSDNKLCQVFECIEPIDDFPKHLIPALIVTYYPELEYGSLNIRFIYEPDGNTYTLYYADGHSTEKTIMFDEDSETYYFAE